MSIDFKDSVVLIKSKKRDDQSFGTGFVIYQDERATYLITCTHVIREVGGEEMVIAGNHPATVITSDPEDDGFDLAVLRVDKPLKHRRLKPSLSPNPRRTFSITGFYAFGKQKLIRELEATLNEQAEVYSGKTNSRTPAWYVKIRDDKYSLEKGNSGAPVIDKTSKKVVGVITTSDRDGKKGLVISIEALKTIWEEMSSSVFDEKEIPKKELPRLMNFEKELQEFEIIAAKDDTDIHLIQIHGPEGGEGKTRLLEEYGRIAKKHNLTVLSFLLGMQYDASSCLNQIIHWFGIEHFPTWSQTCRAKPLKLSRDEEFHWLRNLTNDFFNDLSHYQDAPRLAIFFDQYEKADREFRAWLSHFFLPGLRSQPLLIVVAGRDKIDQNLLLYQEQRLVSLGSLDVSDFCRYAQECRVPIAPEKIRLIHKL